MHTLDIEAIKDILPHRYPFLLVDRILELTPGKRVVAVKNVTINEPFFQGHFPQKAVMPGVLVIEAMAQAGGLMVLSMPEHRGKLAYMGTIDNAKFRRPIVPGDTLIMTVELVRVRSNMGRVQCEARVGEDIAAEATIMFALKSV